jgi:hypothetical protein
LSKIFTVTQVQEDNFHKVPVILRNDLLRQPYQPLRQAYITYDKTSKITTHCSDSANDNGSFDSKQHNLALCSSHTSPVNIVAMQADSEARHFPFLPLVISAEARIPISRDFMEVIVLCSIYGGTSSTVSQGTDLGYDKLESRLEQIMDSCTNQFPTMSAVFTHIIKASRPELSVTRTMLSLSLSLSWYWSVRATPTPNIDCTQTQQDHN